MILFGASGHAKVVIDILEKNNTTVYGLYDEDISKKELLGYKVLGKTKDFDFKHPAIISIGDNVTRAAVSAKLDKADFGTAIHPQSIFGKKVHIDEGTVVMAGVIINSDTAIGRHCILNTASSIDHDCRVGDFVHIAPNATLCGGVTVGHKTLIGAGSTIIPMVKIGENCIIGAGAVVVEDIPDNALVVGNPGKVVRFV